ncbi:MAG: hypothetical protein ACP5D3_06185 [Sulfurovum sp.]
MLRNILFTSLLGLAMVAFTGCTDGKDAATGKCNAGKCDSAKKSQKNAVKANATAPKKRQKNAETHKPVSKSQGGYNDPTDLSPDKGHTE